MSKRFEVQHAVGNGWQNTMVEEDADGTRRPIVYPSREEAQEELDDFLEEQRQAVARGDMNMAYEPSEFRIVELPELGTVMQSVLDDKLRVLYLGEVEDGEAFKGEVIASPNPDAVGSDSECWARDRFIATEEVRSVVADDEHFYIVAWTLQDKKRGTTRDFWEVIEGRRDAKARYDELAEVDDLYTLSIAAIVESSDYPTHPKFKEVK